MLPLTVEYTHAIQPYNSSDAPIFVAASDGLDYVAKIPTIENPCVAACEAISYFICDRIGLPVPKSAWLEFPDGRVAFGSRWESGTNQYTKLPIEARDEIFLKCANQIARFCLIDAFLANPDRHADNILFRESQLDGRWTVIGMDFSWALWRSGFPEKSPEQILASGNTAATLKIMKLLVKLDGKISATIVAGLQTINHKQIESLVAEIPDSARCLQASDLPVWWASQDRLDRAKSLLEVLK